MTTELPRNLSIVLLDPDMVKVDAPAYQFRSGADKQGVTQKGRHHTDHWDPILNGDPILAHERLNGEAFVADGHHRLDLAKRTNATGTGPGKIAALVLREADGYSVEDVRVIAAYKNMAHGRADPIDGARVFKEAQSGRVHQDLLPQLQMDKGNLKISFKLSGLSDKALDTVSSEKIPVEMAAMVADNVTDPIHQENVIRIIGYKLKQMNPYQHETVSPFPLAPIHALPMGRFVTKELERRNRGQQAGFGLVG